MLKLLVNDSQSYWDVTLQHALITYNTTLHSQLGMSPADFIVCKAHECDHKLPVAAEVVKTWNEGHIKYEPYQIGQKVLHKITRIGHQVKYKLQSRYSGPYIICKVQSNGVSYVLEHCISGERKKAHHTQVRPWYEPPEYLQRYFDAWGEDESKVMEREEVTSSSSEGMGGMIGDSIDSTKDMGETESTATSSLSISEQSDESDDERTDRVWLEEDKQNSGLCGNISGRDSDTSQQIKVAKKKYCKSRLSKSLPVRKLGITKDLAHLHCSEVITSMDDGIVEEMYVKMNMDYNNYRLAFQDLDWDMSEPEWEREIKEHEIKENKMSTPIGPLKEHKKKSESGFSGFHTVEIEFIDWVDQSLFVQEELVNKVIQSVEEDKQERWDRTSGEASEFGGFENEIGEEQNMIKLQVLQKLKDQLKHVRRSISGYVSNDSKERQLWRTRCGNTDMNSEALDSEVSDILYPLTAGRSGRKK